MYGRLDCDHALVKHFPGVIPMGERFVRQEMVLGAGLLVKGNDM